MKIIILIIAALAFLIAIWANREPIDYLSEDKIVNVEATDVEMNNAMEQARETLPTFLDRFNNPKENDTLFALKVKISDSFGDEYFWLNQLQIENNKYSGIIDNTPNIVRCVTEDQRYEFTSKDIMDWTYYDNAKMVGNRTLYVLLDRMSKEEADIIRQRLNLK